MELVAGESSDALRRSNGVIDCAAGVREGREFSNARIARSAWIISGVAAVDDFAGFGSTNHSGDACGCTADCPYAGCCDTLACGRVEARFFTGAFEVFD
jgi:hypothetical protein